MVGFNDTSQSKSDEAKEILSANTNEVVAGGGFGLPWFDGKSNISPHDHRQRHILIELQKRPMRKVKEQCSSGLTILL